MWDLGSIRGTGHRDPGGPRRFDCRQSRAAETGDDAVGVGRFSVTAGLSRAGGEGNFADLTMNTIIRLKRFNALILDGARARCFGGAATKEGASRRRIRLVSVLFNLLFFPLILAHLFSSLFLSHILSPGSRCLSLFLHLFFHPPSSPLKCSPPCPPLTFLPPSFALPSLLPFFLLSLPALFTSSLPPFFSPSLPPSIPPSLPDSHPLPGSRRFAVWLAGQMALIVGSSPPRRSWRRAVTSRRAGLPRHRLLGL